MAEVILITITDVRGYRNVDPKLNTVRFNDFAMEIQRTNLRDLLGQALYYAFMSDARTSGIYKELLDGKDYTYNGNTVHYYGLKPLLVYWWLNIATREGDLFHSEHGPISFVDNPQQNFQDVKEKTAIAVSYNQTAQGYANDVIQFLNTNAVSYPLWESTAEKNKSNFVSFRV